MIYNKAPELVFISGPDCYRGLSVHMQGRVFFFFSLFWRRLPVVKGVGGMTMNQEAHTLAQTHTSMHV